MCDMVIMQMLRPFAKKWNSLLDLGHYAYSGTNNIPNQMPFDLSIWICPSGTQDFIPVSNLIHYSFSHENRVFRRSSPIATSMKVQAILNLVEATLGKITITLHTRLSQITRITRMTTLTKPNHSNSLARLSNLANTDHLPTEKCNALSTFQETLASLMMTFGQYGLKISHFQVLTCVILTVNISMLFSTGSEMYYQGCNDSHADSITVIFFLNCISFWYQQMFSSNRLQVIIYYAIVYAHATNSYILFNRPPFGH